MSYLLGLINILVTSPKPSTYTRVKKKSCIHACLMERQIINTMSTMALTLMEIDGSCKIEFNPQD